MILYNLKKNKNKKMPNAYGKYYAYPVVTQTIGMDGLATHMRATTRLSRPVPSRACSPTW